MMVWICLDGLSSCNGRGDFSEAYIGIVGQEHGLGVGDWGARMCQVG